MYEATYGSYRKYLQEKKVKRHSSKKLYLFLMKFFEEQSSLVRVPAERVSLGKKTGI